MYRNRDRVGESTIDRRHLLIMQTERTMKEEVETKRQKVAAG